MVSSSPVSCRTGREFPRAALLTGLLVMGIAACTSSERSASLTETTTTIATTDTTIATTDTTVVTDSAVPSSGSTGAPTTRAGGTAPPTTAIPAGPDEFDDHTVPRIDSVEQFDELARSGLGTASVVKFSIPEMERHSDVIWLDSTFYEIHDQWYWFRLLNGEQVPGFDTEPVDGLQFTTVDEAVEWAEGQNELPLDLRFINSRTYGKRLYSDDFYRLGFTHDVRNYGLGSLIHFFDAADGADHWLFELEFSDSPTADEVARYFELLEATLSQEIADRLEWVLRSPAQEAAATAMEESQLPYHDRIVRYQDLVPAGQVEVYNPGVAAGRLLIVDGVTTTLADAAEHDIVVIENVPDVLPPASALITSSPQTPLAHVNLLARNRGIPNASQAGVLDDAGLRQAARVRARAIVRATVDGELEIVLISRDDYDEWQALGRTSRIAVPAIDRATTPTIVDLTDLAATISDESDIDPLRPLIGGKAAGFLTLIAADGVTSPQRPQAITVEPYLEHLDKVSDELDAMLTDPDFVESPRVRFLFLEGPDDFANAYPTDDGERLAAETIQRHPVGTPLGDILAADGFKKYFRNVPMTPATLASITARLTETYPRYADTQGLRFRSSSSVEDIEGFTGAGLYDSNTGFLVPDAQPDDDDRDKTVEAAIKKTWSSYWAFEAFAEREIENVDHRSGAMGVLVHARFDDPLELANGVATFTLLPGSAADRAVAVVNVQLGDESVANPDPTSGVLPEVVEVRLADDGSISIERRASSTLADGDDVLTDDELNELFTQLRSVTELWRERTNQSLSVAQAVETVTLDFEFKWMAPGWPARQSGEVEPARLVVKQARSLDPGLRGIPNEVRDLPVPRDVLARARRITQVSCAQRDGDPEGKIVTRIEVTTDPTIEPDLSYAEAPFVYEPKRSRVVDDDCVDTILFSTPRDFLLDLLQTGTRLELT